MGLRKNRAEFSFRVADANGQGLRIQSRESSIIESSPIPQAIALEIKANHGCDDDVGHD